MMADGFGLSIATENEPKNAQSIKTIMEIRQLIKILNQD